MDSAMTWQSKNPPAWKIGDKVGHIRDPLKFGFVFGLRLSWHNSEIYQNTNGYYYEYFIGQTVHNQKLVAESELISYETFVNEQLTRFAKTLDLQ